VPSVTGLSVTAATAALEAQGFIVANGGSVNSNYASGLVAYASQPAGAQYPSGSTITIYVSNGVPPKPPKPPKNDNGGGGNHGGDGRRDRGGDRDRRGDGRR
jgi:beta-lactam-binding protein with PASTA domain